MWILDHKRDTLYRVSDRVFSLSKDEALGSPCTYRKTTHSSPQVIKRFIDKCIVLKSING